MYGPAAITYRTFTFPQGDAQHICVFTPGLNRHLMVNQWDGNNWRWADHGTGNPNEPTLFMNFPAAVTYEAGGRHWIYVFSAGSDGHLYTHWWEGWQGPAPAGQRWHWADQFANYSVGPPPVFVNSVDAVTYEQDGIQHIHVFAGDSDGNLWQNWWDGSEWSWANRGSPRSHFAITSFAAITYQQDGTQFFHIFVEDADGHLWMCEGHDGTWQWGDQFTNFSSGNPPHACFRPTAITYQEGGLHRMYVFAEGDDGHLLVNWSDGHTWQWADQFTNYSSGNPPVQLGHPGAITYERGGVQYIYVFVGGDLGDLWVNWWDGNGWHWAHQGNVGGPGLFLNPPAAITFQDGGVQRIQVFALGEGITDQLWVDFDAVGDLYTYELVGS